MEKQRRDREQDQSPAKVTSPALGEVVLQSGGTATPQANDVAPIGTISSEQPAPSLHGRAPSPKTFDIREKIRKMKQRRQNRASSSSGGASGGYSRRLQVIPTIFCAMTFSFAHIPMGFVVSGCIFCICVCDGLPFPCWISWFADACILHICECNDLPFTLFPVGFPVVLWGFMVCGFMSCICVCDDLSFICGVYLVYSCVVSRIPRCAFHLCRDDRVLTTESVHYVLHPSMQ